MGRITKTEFKAYQKIHAELWPSPLANDLLPTTSDMHHHHRNITIVVDAAPAAIIARRATSTTTMSKNPPPTFVELERRNGILFEALVTRIATHRDVLVIDRWYTKFPKRIYRRLAAVVNGDVRLPTISLLQHFRGLASLNEPMLDCPWRSTFAPVVYQSTQNVAQAFDDLMSGLWEEGWFDVSGNISREEMMVVENQEEMDDESDESGSGSSGGSGVADVYVHVAFWSPAWRTNQLMRVLSRHLSRGQNIIFFTPPTKTKKDEDAYAGHPLVRWLLSLQGTQKERSGVVRKRGDDVDYEVGVESKKLKTSSVQ